MRVLIFTGAGFSQPSGLSTFRGDGGLWEGISVDEICSVDALIKNPEKVNRFYHDRWVEEQAAQPNKAHLALAEMESQGHEVLIITQNVDTLHERAGSKDVIHLHGRLDSVLVDGEWVERNEENSLTASRPDIVLFGEDLLTLDYAWDRITQMNPDMVWILGTSMKVSPANQLPRLAKKMAKKSRSEICFVIVDKEDPEEIAYRAKVTPRSKRETSIYIQGDVEDVVPSLLCRINS